MPPHLSIVHVEQEPQLLRHMSLFENLTLGFKHSAPPLKQVCEVCEALGLAAKWISHLRAEHAEMEAEQKGSMKRKPTRHTDVGMATKVNVDADAMLQMSWQDQLSATDRRVIQLARALITNPHVLVLHRPFASLDEDVAARVLSALRRFIEHRSLYTDSSPASLLSRTVIFSTSTNDERTLLAADDVIIVGTPVGGASLLEEGISEVNNEGAACQSFPASERTTSSLVSRPAIVRQICSSSGGAAASRDSSSSNGQSDSTPGLHAHEVDAVRRFTERATRLSRKAHDDDERKEPSYWPVAGQRLSTSNGPSHDATAQLVFMQNHTRRTRQRNRRRVGSIDLESLV